MEVVLDEKLMLSTVYRSIGSDLKCENMVTVLAVPESPTNMAGFLSFITWFSSHEYRSVSTVGTRIWANLFLAGGTYSGTFLSHRTKDMLSMS